MTANAEEMLKDKDKKAIKDKLQLIETQVFEKVPSRIDIYRYEFTSLEDTVNLMRYLECEYGVIDDVFAYRREDGEGTYSIIGEYDSIDEFACKFPQEMDENIGLILDCRDRWTGFRLNYDPSTSFGRKYDHNIVQVHVSWRENEGVKIHDPKYYRYGDTDFIVKFDNFSLFRYDEQEKRWKHDRELRYGFFARDDNEYTRIEDYKDPAENS